MFSSITVCSLACQTSIYVRVCVMHAPTHPQRIESRGGGMHGRHTVHCAHPLCAMRILKLHSLATHEADSNTMHCKHNHRSTCNTECNTCVGVHGDVHGLTHRPAWGACVPAGRSLGLHARNMHQDTAHSNTSIHCNTTRGSGSKTFRSSLNEQAHTCHVITWRVSCQQCPMSYVKHDHTHHQ